MSSEEGVWRSDAVEKLNQQRMELGKPRFKSDDVYNLIRKQNTQLDEARMYEAGQKARAKEEARQKAEALREASKRTAAVRGSGQSMAEAEIKSRQDKIEWDKANKKAAQEYAQRELEKTTREVANRSKK
jgi:hypothetical protein